MNKWKCYLAICKDLSIYLGITTDVERRIKEHNTSKKGSKYCRSRRPIILFDFIEGLTKSEALKIEYKIRQYSRKQKIDEFLKLKKELENGRQKS